MSAIGRCPLGYTLLELVVVMSILAMATALAAPPSYRMIRTWQEATQVQDVIEQIEHLPSTVRDSGKPLDTDTEGSKLPVDLPEDWTLHMQTPLRVLANGACSDAQATLVTAQQSIELRIQAPFCGVQRIEP